MLSHLGIRGAGLQAISWLVVMAKNRQSLHKKRSANGRPLNFFSCFRAERDKVMVNRLFEKLQPDDVKLGFAGCLQKV